MTSTSGNSVGKGEQKGGGTPKMAQKMLANMHNQISLLKRLPEKDDLDEIITAPLFTYPVLKNAMDLVADSSETPFAQYALLAGDADILRDTPKQESRIFYNVTTPSSMFICGSQGSGKSHSLSCMLENCLIPAPILGHLPKPLTGIVFHYDTFTSDSGGVPCEAAYLSTDPRVKVRVLCPPTNVTTIKDTYKFLKNVKVEELRLKESYLNTKRMLDLMAFGDGHQPLYMHVIQRILRDMRIEQQQTRSGFKYNDFVRKLENEKLMPDQLRPLQQRLDTLESFLVPEQTGSGSRAILSNSRAKNHTNKEQSSKGTSWMPQSGELIIVDLSCPCITPNMACSLFNICLAIFLEQKSTIGRVIALDEAHKYMGETVECETLTNNLLSVIRLQRHLGARVVISTQEPTISPKLLDLCSITIVHRFTSPDWLKMLTKHIAGISMASMLERTSENNDQATGRNGTANNRSLHDMVASSSDPIIELFSHIVKLKTGEALVFAPSAMVNFEKQNSEVAKSTISTRLAHRILRVVIRSRITVDGGKSIMAI